METGAFLMVVIFICIVRHQNPPDLCEAMVVLSLGTG